MNDRPKAKAILLRIIKPSPFKVGLVAFVLLTAYSAYIHQLITRTDAASWNVVCHLDHFAADDPIVHPGAPGQSHMHSFYGNVSANAASTLSTLQASKSSCSRGMGNGDLSSYWIPSLYQKTDSRHIALVSAKYQTLAVYYQRAGGITGPKVQPLPMGLRIVAGAASSITPQPASVVQWNCDGTTPPTPGIPTCPNVLHPLHATLIFPNCWDGVHLDSPNHQSHMAYPAEDGTCPWGHPVALPKITYDVSYSQATGGSNYLLSSGSQYSFHGDFINAWDAPEQAALVTSCLNTPHDCNDLYRVGNTLIRPDGDLPPIHLSGKD
jgi:hypothetical protein